MRQDNIANTYLSIYLPFYLSIYLSEVKIYSKACVNALMSLQNFMSHVNPNHDGRKAYSICWEFSYFCRVSQSQRNKHHTSEHLKDIIAKSARQFIGNRQQDPAEYLEQIMNQCSEFKQLTSHQSIQNFTCISCNTKTQTLDDRNVLHV